MRIDVITSKGLLAANRNRYSTSIEAAKQTNHANKLARKGDALTAVKGGFCAASDEASYVNGVELFVDGGMAQI